MASFSSPLHSPSISPLMSPVIRPISGVSSPTDCRMSREQHPSGRLSPSGLLPSTSSISLLNLSFSQTSISEVETAPVSESSQQSPVKRVSLTSFSPPSSSRYVNTAQQSRVSHYFASKLQSTSSVGLEITNEEQVPDSPSLRPSSLDTSPTRLALGESNANTRSPNWSPCLTSPRSPRLGPVTPSEEPMTPIVLGD